MLNRVKLQLILASFWFVSVYLALGALVPWQWAWRCAWLNLIIGMVGLLMVTRSDDGDRIFYNGPRENESGRFIIAVLWALPAFWFAASLIWWVMRLLGVFDY